MRDITVRGLIELRSRTRRTDDRVTLLNAIEIIISGNKRNPFGLYINGITEGM